MGCSSVVGGPPAPLPGDLSCCLVSGHQRGRDRPLQSGCRQPHQDEDGGRRHRGGCVPRRLGERLCCREKRVRTAREGRLRAREAREYTHPRHRKIRAAREHRPALLGHALSPGPEWKDRCRSLRRDPRGDEEVAIGRLVMSTRERICAIEIEESGLLMTTLRTAEEVRDVAVMPDVPLPKPDPQMLAIAEKIVDQQAGDFNPDEFVDRYEDALRDLIEEKKKGHAPRARPAANDDGKVVDLMSALRRSLKASGGAGDAAPAAERRRPAASRAASAGGKPRPRRRGRKAA